jgi:hypothetical protein
VTSVGVEVIFLGYVRSLLSCYNFVIITVRGEMVMSHNEIKGDTHNTVVPRGWA